MFLLIILHIKQYGISLFGFETISFEMTFQCILAGTSFDNFIQIVSQVVYILYPMKYH